MPFFTLSLSVFASLVVSCCNDDDADSIHKHVNPCGDDSQCIGVVMAVSSSHRELPPLYDTVPDVGSS